MTAQLACPACPPRSCWNWGYSCTSGPGTTNGLNKFRSRSVRLRGWSFARPPAPAWAVSHFDWEVSGGRPPPWRPVWLDPPRPSASARAYFFLSEDFRARKSQGTWWIWLSPDDFARNKSGEVRETLAPLVMVATSTPACRRVNSAAPRPFWYARTSAFGVFLVEA